MSHQTGGHHMTPFKTQARRVLWPGLALMLVVLLAAPGPLGVAVAAPAAAETPAATETTAATPDAAPTQTPEASPTATDESADLEAPTEAAQPSDPQAEGVTYQEEDEQDGDQGGERGKRK